MYGSFIASMNAIQKEIHDTALEKGWWDKERCDAEVLCLMHSEISEALEGLRDGNPISEKLEAPFTQVEEELADLFIRMSDFAERRGHNIAEAIVAKIAYNKGRPYRHGKKF